MQTLSARLMASCIPIPEAGCWLWTASTAKGYGQIRIGGKSTSTHRAAYEAFKGPIPTGLHVCHRCDTPICINPDHLFLGTPRDNAQDKVAKGRAAAQERKTHCLRGHLRTYSATGATRSCKTCNSEAVRRYKRKASGEAK